MVFVWGVNDVLQMMGPQFDGVCVGCYICSPDDGVLVWWCLCGMLHMFSR